MNNVGDEAFRHVFSQVFHDQDIEFVTPVSDCNNPDVVILGGGAVASPFYLDILPDCPRYAVGIDLAYESEIELIAKAGFKAVYVRNGTDAARMKEKLDCSVKCIPDLAFLIKPSGHDVVGKYRKSPERKSVGILVTDYVNPAIDRPMSQFAARAWEFKQKMVHELNRLDTNGYEVILIPCSTGGYGDDRRINLDLAAFVNFIPTIIMDTIGPQDMVDLIAGLDATVCMRFHAHIFSIIAGTPLVSIDFTRKVQLLLEDQAVGKSVGRFDHADFHILPLFETIEAAIAEDNKSRLLSIAASYRDDLQHAMTRLRQEILGSYS